MTVKTRSKHLNPTALWNCGTHGFLVESFDPVTCDLFLLRKGTIFVSSILVSSPCVGLFGCLIKLYVHVPPKASRIGEIKYIHNVVYSWYTIACPNLLAGLNYLFCLTPCWIKLPHSNFNNLKDYFAQPL